MSFVRFNKRYTMLFLLIPYTLLQFLCHFVHVCNASHTRTAEGKLDKFIFVDSLFFTS